jgi:hypothetical protein
MHVAKKARKTAEQCWICHEAKPSGEFIAMHRGRYRVCKICKSHLNRLDRFKIGPVDYEKLLVVQNYRCAICELDLVHEKNNTVVDHCHETNEIRGVLCRNCNTGLGNFKDKNALLANAAKYLIAPPARGIVERVVTTNRQKYLADVMRAGKCNTQSDQ